MNDIDDDRSVGKLKQSLGTSAELKLSLITLRSILPDTPIFVFEGEDDRAVYYSWTKSVSPTLNYEPFTCKGKAAVLKLKAAVDRDVNGISSGVFFFVDSDFDGLRGVDPGATIYLTDGYSIENQLVNACVLEEVLKVELNCHGNPRVRGLVVDIFSDVYSQFLEASRDINFLIFAVRKLGIETEDDLPSSLGRAVAISMHGAVRDEAISAEAVVRPCRQVLPDEFQALEEEFGLLDPPLHYRGKFALAFLMRWLGAVAADRRSTESATFGGMDMEARTRVDRLNVSSLSGKSRPPESFKAFLKIHGLCPA